MGSQDCPALQCRECAREPDQHGHRSQRQSACLIHCDLLQGGVEDPIRPQQTPVQDPHQDRLPG
eukprot:4515397-Heterocapsa_arctica.AAC.1